jgi:hypothetical protein
MDTIFDWISIILFSGVVVLYLQRSAAAEPTDKVWHYLPPAAGCAGANYFGNHDEPALAIGLVVATIAYVYYVLKPFERP